MRGAIGAGIAAADAASATRAPLHAGLDEELSAEGDKVQAALAASQKAMLESMDLAQCAPACGCRGGGEGGRLTGLCAVVCVCVCLCCVCMVWCVCASPVRGVWRTSHAGMQWAVTTRRGALRSRAAPFRVL